MKDYEIIGWPDIQAYMELEGFEENSTLITPNDNMGIEVLSPFILPNYISLILSCC